jgi:hypothetical protein
VKVFNITDAATSALTAQGLANQAIKVGETVIPKGGSADIRGTARERAELQVFLKVGAVALDELPPAYAARRGLNLDGTSIMKPEEIEELQEALEDLAAESEPEPTQGNDEEEEF